MTSDPQFGGPGIIGSNYFSDWFSRIGTEIKPAGEDDIEGVIVDFDTYGKVSCECRVTKTASVNPIAVGPLEKPKVEDEVPPRFKLIRDGAGFTLK